MEDKIDRVNYFLKNYDYEVPNYYRAWIEKLDFPCDLMARLILIGIRVSVEECLKKDGR